MIAGGAIGYFKPFPLPQLKALVHQLKVKYNTKTYQSSRVITPSPWSFQQPLQSVHLPLYVTGLDFAKLAELEPFSGGICAFDRQIFIADKNGAIFYANNDFNKTRQLDAPPLVTNKLAFFNYHSVNYDNQGFMRGFRVHDIECVTTGSKRYLLVSHDYFDPLEKNSRLLISRIQLDDDKNQVIGPWQQVYTGQFNNKVKFFVSAGARMTPAGDGSIYFSVAENKQLDIHAPDIDEEIKNSDFGSIFKLDILTGEKIKISAGHRNPMGLALRESGELLSTEHGPRGGDELNLISPGNHYGWPFETLGVSYSKYSYAEIKPPVQHKVFTKPIITWLPSIAPSNLIEVRDFHPRWNGDLLIATLKSRSLYRVRLVNNRVLFSEPIWIGERIRDMIQLTNGEIVLWTDSAKLMFLQVDWNRLSKDTRAFMPDDILHLADCLNCHHMGETNPHHPAPSLSGLFSRPIASDNFDSYSAALKKLEGNWSKKTLMQFINSPGSIAPGTVMPANKSYTEEELHNIIKALETLN